MSGIKYNMLPNKFIDCGLQSTSSNMHQVIDYDTSILMDHIRETNSIHDELEEFKLGSSRFNQWKVVYSMNDFLFTRSSLFLIL